MLQPTAVDVMWLLYGTSLVFFMQAGFTLIEVGSGKRRLSPLLPFSPWRARQGTRNVRLYSRSRTEPLRSRALVHYDLSCRRRVGCAPARTSAGTPPFPPASNLCLKNASKRTWDMWEKPQTLSSRPPRLSPRAFSRVPIRTPLARFAILRCVRRCLLARVPFHVFSCPT